MGRHPSKETRATAFELLSIYLQGYSWSDTLRALGIQDHDVSARLAFKALGAVEDGLGLSRYEFGDDRWVGARVEAAALVESGWCVGDEIEILPLPVTEEVIENATGFLEQETYNSFAPEPFLGPSDESTEVFVQEVTELIPGGASYDHMPRPDSVADAIESGDPAHA